MGTTKGDGRSMMMTLLTTTIIDMHCHLSQKCSSTLLSLTFQVLFMKKGYITEGKMWFSYISAFLLVVQTVFIDVIIFQ